VADLNIPHKLDKLQHLLTDRMNIKMVEFHAADLAHFEYKGRYIPIVLRGCSNLEKATMMFRGSKGLGRVFTLLPSILPLKIPGVQADIHGYEQVTWRLLILFVLLCLPQSSLIWVLISSFFFVFVMFKLQKMTTRSHGMFTL
jgi:hypothetical protein